MAKIKGVLGKAHENGKNEFSICEFDNSNYKNIYKLINCDLFDCPVRTIGNNEYVIFCDDEGLLKSNPKIIGVTSNRRGVVEFLVGDIFICKADEDADIVSLTDEEIAEVMSSVVEIGVGNKKLTILRTNI